MMAEMDSWEEKRRVMGRKKELKERVFIDNDMTRKEKEVQQRLRRNSSAKRKRKEKGIC